MIIRTQTKETKIGKITKKTTVTISIPNHINCPIDNCVMTLDAFNSQYVCTNQSCAHTISVEKFMKQETAKAKIKE